MRSRLGGNYAGIGGDRREEDGRPVAASVVLAVAAVFAVDVLKRERCGGRLRMVELAKKPDDAARVLGERGYARAPPRAPPDAERPVSTHEQLRLVFG